VGHRLGPMHVAARDAGLGMGVEEPDQGTDAVPVGKGIGVQQVDVVRQVAPPHRPRDREVVAVGEPAVVVRGHDLDPIREAALDDASGDLLEGAVLRVVVDDGDPGIRKGVELAHQSRERVERHVGGLVVQDDGEELHR
jgi:hypothetical protein